MSIGDHDEWLRWNALNQGHAQLLTVPAVEDDYVLAVEDNGYQGARSETLAALSRNGKAASVFWNVNALFRITFAQNGNLVYSATWVSTEVCRRTVMISTSTTIGTRRPKA